jgi:hypothetical protein
MPPLLPANSTSDMVLLPWAENGTGNVNEKGYNNQEQNIYNLRANELRKPRLNRLGICHGDIRYDRLVTSINNRGRSES